MQNTFMKTAIPQNSKIGGKVQSPERKKVLVVRLSAIGDTIIATRTLRALMEIGLEPIFCTQEPGQDVAAAVPGLKYLVLAQKDAAPQAWVRESEESRLWRRETNISDLFIASDKSISVLDLQCTVRSRRFLRQLRRANPGVHFDVMKVEKKTWARVSRVLSARFALTQKRPAHALGSVFAPPAGLGRIHDLQSHLIAKSFCVSFDNLARGPWLSPVAVERVLSTLELKSGKSYVVLFTGASGPLKAWGVENFEKLIRILLSKASLTFVMIGGRDEVADGEKLATLFPGSVRSLCGRLKVSETLSVISGASYVVTGDSFPAHACDALGVPAAVIFGATSPWFGFIPMSQNICVHYLELSCSPCTRHGRGKCRFGNLLCLKGITPENVAEEMMRKVSLG